MGGGGKQGYHYSEIEQGYHYSKIEQEVTKLRIAFFLCWGGGGTGREIGLHNNNKKILSGSQFVWESIASETSFLLLLCK